MRTMKKMLLSIFVGLFAFAAFGQTGEISQQGCATVTTPTEIQAVYDFVQNGALSKSTGMNDTIPISLHIVGKDDGTGYYNLNTMFTVICQLNQKYIPAGIYFTVKWPLQYHNSTSFYTHTSGDAFMNQNNVANTVNIYFVGDPAGACGYYTYGADAIAISISCAASNNTTVAHEVGHYLGLPHTFYGWENGTPANPERVTRGAGANCSTAGDGFCDTEADYQSARWNCPYSGTMTDVTGTPYRPDSSLYMGYSTDACMSRFSTQQIARMQTKLHNDRNNLLTAPHGSYTALDTPRVQYPVDTLYSDNKVIRWRKVPGAEYYRFRLWRTAAAGLDYQTAFTTDTFITVSSNINFISTSQYTAVVTPFASANVCGAKTRQQNFYFANSDLPPTAVENINGGDAFVNISPNPAHAEGWKLQTAGIASGRYTVSLSTFDGRIVSQQQVSLSSSLQVTTVSAKDLPNGMYFIRVAGAGGSWTQKAILQR